MYEVNLRALSTSGDIPAELGNTTWMDVFDARELVLNGVIDLEAYQNFIVKR